MIARVNHVTLSVLHIDRSFVFYNEILGMRPVAKWPIGAYLQAGDLWKIRQIGEKEEKRGFHRAFLLFNS